MYFVFGTILLLGFMICLVIAPDIPKFWIGVALCVFLFVLNIESCRTSPEYLAKKEAERAERQWIFDNCVLKAEGRYSVPNGKHTRTVNASICSCEGREIDIITEEVCGR